MSTQQQQSQQQNTKARLNEGIRARNVRLIDAEGQQVGVVSIQEALRLASDAGLDLVEIAPNIDPPVCKIMNYSKFLYEKKKQESKARKNQQQIQLKEIKLRPVTDEGDYQVKLRNLIRFLTAGDKAKVTVRFKGRELAHQELGREVMLRMINDLAEYADPDNQPKFEGRQLVVVFSPKKKTK